MGVTTEEMEALAERASGAGQHAVSALLLAICCAVECGDDMDVMLAVHVEAFMAGMEGDVRRMIAELN